MNLHRLMSAVLVFFLLQSCYEAPPVFHAGDNPPRLSDWNLFTLRGGQLQPHSATLPFQPANALFSDYAHKLRSLWIPEGRRIETRDGELDYPVGTVLSKTFYYPVAAGGRVLKQTDADLVSITMDDHRLLETRLLIRREQGWQAFPYVWNDDQTEAFLRVAGASERLSLNTEQGTQNFTYFIPNENQCAACHVTDYPDGGMQPLGAVSHQLGDQLMAIVERGWLDEPPEPEPVPRWQDTALPIKERAVAYLDINCGHCHSPTGPADTSALLLDGFHRSDLDRGRCKPPVAAGRGAGNLRYGMVPGQPELSILVFRMASGDPAVMMPELGRSLVHAEGVALVSDWIEEMPGSCN
ncbi:MAG: SO2930 family diheme c-type cytochrome [Pseudohongiellaceae bacterium]